ncbi:DUF3801 domain-containing protein [Enterococcus faecium]|uniref:PcfB protein n=1 Tax=Enterococcus faecium EnGen0192 TaxID=1157487 RepID=A0A829F0N2_ENTFC|nr:DUF3801 domain-containing protein [Enterococcus faecium]MDU4270231.1 DUF3801 domain-containing protein [Enterococcus hirae]EJC3722560.1 DUF3801 domain-containing protein [Enterococcus faecium]EOM07864.1 PcfB protein [Enterococcus faecium EnGen0261]EOM19202.1 PcfB protein [Enterococcus faecium EnGen0192]MCU1986393.1 DUF3801 domain-containing protein [Enterococcus faecium]
MEQEEIIHKYYVLGTTTLDKTLQVLSHLSMDGLNKIKDSYIPLKGETGLYKMMSRSDPLTSAYLNEKVDLNKLKTHLQEQGLPFAFKEVKGGTNLYFRVKDKELAKKALERVISGLNKEPKKILRTPGTMTFKEKLEYAQKSPTYKGSINKSKQQSKGRGI